jgi:hypothetical protein
MRVVKRATERHQPNRAWTFEDSPAYHAGQERLASLVGVIALALPVLLWASSACFRASLSSYYFASLSGDLFVAGLAAIATCLLAFTGESRADFWLTTGAAVAALAVALIPTANPGCALGPGYQGRFSAKLAEADGVVVIESPSPLDSYFAAFRGAAILHDVAALFLLGFLAYLCLVVFTRRVPELHLGPNRRATPIKRLRDGIYRTAGTVIVLGMVLMVVGAWVRHRAGPEPSWWDEWRLTFWSESVALWAFGAAWIVKGRLFGLALRDSGEPTS